MKTLALISLLLLCPAFVSAYSPYPDFNDDAKPILHRQHGLLHYILSHYDVKPIGYSQHPGNEDHPPLPPFIFKARPIDSEGPYLIGLCIFDGEPGHILKVFHIHSTPSAVPSSPSSAPAETPASAPQNTPQDSLPASATPPQSGTPTSDTPTGPINN